MYIKHLIKFNIAGIITIKFSILFMSNFVGNCCKIFFKVLLYIYQSNNLDLTYYFEFVEVFCMSERLDNFLKEYSTNEFLDIYHFFTKEQLEIIKKLGLEIENKQYSVSDYDALRIEILKYYNEPNELNKTDVTKEECELILDIFQKLSDYYNL